MDRQEPDAALALARWEEFQQVTDDDRRQRRFRRRAFERARDRALQAFAMRLKPAMLARTTRPDSQRIRRPARRRRGAARRVIS